MQNELQKESGTRKSLSLPRECLERLKTVKWRTEIAIGKKQSWGKFILQLCLMGELMCGTPMVKAIRCAMWVYEAQCPECDQMSAPLRRKGNIVWGVNCEKCGKRFIAIA